MTIRKGRSAAHAAVFALVLLITPSAPGNDEAPPPPKKAGTVKAPPAAAKPASAPAARASDIPKVAFETYTLPNGLRVILHVDRKLPIVHVNEWFHVGSKNERPGRTGFAHLFEHMMFQGSKNASDKYFVYAERAGANLREGGVNGTTNNDRTNYFITAPSGNLEQLLWLESDRLATLTDGMTKEKLDNQRDVVKNERRQGLENQPYGRAFKLITENLYPAGHPYSWTVIGSHEDLTAASLEDVTEFFKTYYTPNNLSMVIAGDFEPAEAKRLVAKYFGGIPAGPPLDRPRRFVPTLAGERVVEATDRVPQERVYIAWPTPAYYDKGDAELDLTADVLTNGLSSRLTKALVYDKQLCTDVSAFQASKEISSEFVVMATARPGSALPEIEDVITKEIARYAKSGPTAGELERAKTRREFTFVSGLERIGGFGGKADHLNDYATFLGDPDKLAWDVERYRRATAADVRDVAARFIDTQNRLVVRFHPETSGRADAAPLDRSKEPAAGKDRHFQAPEVKSAKLPNGLEVLVVERPELPKVAVVLASRAGSVADPAGKSGTAHLTATTMHLGTPTRNALQIEDALGDLGTSIQGSASREYATLSLEVLKRNLSPALAIFSDVVLHPSYPEAEVAREKKLHLDALSQDSRNANALAARIRPMLVFGADHPYGRPVRGLPDTVSSIGREDLVRFHAQRYRPSGSALIFVGDVTLDAAVQAARTALGSWSGGAPEKVEIPEPRPMDPGKVYLVDRQDAAQTVVMQALPAPRRADADFYTLQLVDAVWGGGFGTRLNLNLREQKGYSYGVFSSLAGLGARGLWFAGGGVQTNKTKESVAEFSKELRDLAGARPISEKELTDARAVRVRGYAQQFESQGRIAGLVAVLWANALPMTELQREVDETEKVPLDAVVAAERKYVVPERTALLLVGDASKIRPGVEELKLGDVVMLDVEGRPKAR